MGKNLRETQEALETQWAEAGYQRYINGYQSSPFSSTQAGSFIMGKAFVELKKAIVKYRKELSGPRTFIQKAIFFCLHADEVAVVTLQYMMDFAFKNTVAASGRTVPGCFSSMVIGLANRLCDLFNWRATAKEAPEYTRYFSELMKGCHRIQRLRMVKDLEFKVLEGNILKLPTQDKIPIGYAMAKLAIESTGIFHMFTSFSKSGHKINLISPEPELLKQLMDKLEYMAWCHPMYMPMVCPPEPWTGVKTGGYLTLPTKIISHSGKHVAELWNQGFLQPRVSVLNHIQNVPFVIDSDTLTTAEEAYRIGHRAVPVSDMGVEFPRKPWQNREEREILKAHRPDVYMEYTSSVAKLHREFYNSHTVGKRIQFLRTLSVARKFQLYESIWFPWNMDYRGRFYPIPTGLSPQGDDIGKALLRFANEEPWQPHAWDALKIHGAGLMGVDKVPFSERISFINQHHEEILRASDDPFSSSWWELADKPWRMLQWCREYTGLYRGTQKTTGIPVDLDGSCNGLQHLSMAMRDQHTGALVNLVPSNKPADIYTDVQRKVEELLPEDSPWKGRVTRKLVKRNVMTTPYNVTKIGMGDQIKDELQRLAASGMLTKQERFQSNELRDYNYEAIQMMLGKSAELMRWYTEVSRVYMDHGLTIRWDLPDGFRVIQDIPKYLHKEVQLEGRTVSVSYREPDSCQDPRRNGNALAPNITHSMDAAHMALWVKHLMTVDPKTPFVCVHDSFGLPVTKLRDIGTSILETFVELYESFDIIESLRQDFRAQTQGLELPAPPDRGDLDLSLVRKSIYAFA